MDFLSHQLCRLWKRFFAVLEHDLAAMPAHRLALSYILLHWCSFSCCLWGGLGCPLWFAASCLLRSDHCSSSHQILEFNPKPNKQRTAKRKITNAFHILTYSGFHGFVLGFSLLPHGKSAAVCLESSCSIQAVQSRLCLSALNSLDTKEGLIFLVTAWHSHCSAVEILFG